MAGSRAATTSTGSPAGQVGQSCQRHLVAQQGGALEHGGGLGGQRVEARGQQAPHVLHHALGAHLCVVPNPLAGGMIERQRADPVELLEQLPHEEGVAAGALGQHLRQRRHRIGGAPKGGCHQRLHRDSVEGLEVQGLVVHGGRVDAGLQAVHAVGRIDLAVAPGPDEQQVSGARLGEQVAHQLKAGRVGPLQVVDEQDQGVRGAAEGLDGA